MKATTLVPSRLLAREAVDLGRLVLDIKAPEQDYFDPKSLVGGEVIVQQKYNFSEIIQRTSGSKLHGFLTALISAASSKREGRQTQIGTIRNTTYQIKNSSEVFVRICGDDNAKKWLERAIRRGSSVFMVVGIQTILDAQILEHTVVEGMRDLNITIPAGAAVSAATGIPVPVVELDTEGGASWQNRHHVLSKFFAPGEQVYAVQYRKVRFSWFSSKRLDSVELERSNLWKVYWLRSAVEAESDEEDEDEGMDVVNAEITEEGIPDTDIAGQGYEIFKRQDSEDEVIFYAP